MSRDRTYWCIVRRVCVPLNRHIQVSLICQKKKKSNIRRHILCNELKSENVIVFYCRIDDIGCEVRCNAVCTHRLSSGKVQKEQYNYKLLWKGNKAFKVYNTIPIRCGALDGCEKSQLED